MNLIAKYSRFEGCESAQILISYKINKKHEKLVDCIHATYLVLYLNDFW